VIIKTDFGFQKFRITIYRLWIWSSLKNVE